MLEKNTVIHADCLDVMRSIPDKSVDLILTDPPYGINISARRTIGGNPAGRNKKVKHTQHDILTWDKKTPSREYFNEMFRISKNQIIFGANYFLEYLKNTNCFLVWDKKNGNNYFSDCELAWTSFKTAVRKYEYMWCGMIQEYMGDMKEKRVHPTQKPFRLFVEILKDYSKDCDTIFDPFAGSGTTAIACMLTGRNYILVEKEKKYVDIINRRIREHKEDYALYEAMK